MTAAQKTALRLMKSDNRTIANSAGSPVKIECRIGKCPGSKKAA
jgi:hypothetical protein